MRVWLLAVILILLAAASALFSAIETAFFSLQPLQLRRLRANTPRLADRLSRLLENPRRVLSALLLADATVNVPLIVLSIYTLREAVSLPIPFGLAAGFIFALIAIVCDLVPKVVALGQPYRLAKMGARVMGPLLPALDPIARVLQRWSERIADSLTPARIQSHIPLTGAELETLVQVSAEEGILEATESEIIQEILKLGEKTDDSKGRPVLRKTLDRELPRSYARETCGRHSRHGRRWAHEFGFRNGRAWGGRF